MGIMAQANLSYDAGKQTETYAQLRCVEGRIDEIHTQIIIISSINIFLSITAFLGNTLILVALHKDSSLHPPSILMYRCLATTDLCVGLILEPATVIYWLSLVHEDWNLCLYAATTYFITGYTLSSVSLFTITTISVDRLLALLLGLRYRQVVTLKRIYLLLTIFWTFSILAGTSYFIHPHIAVLCSYICIPLCLVTATFSYTKIFHRLHNIPKCAPSQQGIQQPRQPAPLKLTRYRKAVYNALWVQLALVVCYLPYIIVIAAVDRGRPPSNSTFVVFQCVETLVFLNSSLNPFLYCWRIAKVRKAVKETIRQVLCCPWN